MDLDAPDQHLLEVRLQGSLQLDIGRVPAVWVELPDELAAERGRFDVHIKFGDGTDVAGIQFKAGTAWIPLPSSIVREAAAAGKLAVFTEVPLEDGQETPYLTIDFPDR